MKVVILAGGFGTRLSEETVVKPKPMVEIGGMPILWHIMKIYSSYGFNEFIICLGYKGYLIKEFFGNYYLHQSDVTLDIKRNNVKVESSIAEPWKISLIDTGNESMTGGRIKRIQEYIGEESFFLTYGDGLADIDLNALISEHESNDSLCTLTAVQPPARFGALDIVNGKVQNFFEKPKGDGLWINGGFMICNHQVFDFIDDDQTIWEKKSLPLMAEKGKLSVYKHYGFWRAMDTLNDKRLLNSLWNEKEAKWKIWS